MKDTPTYPTKIGGEVLPLGMADVLDYLGQFGVVTPHCYIDSLVYLARKRVSNNGPSVDPDDYPQACVGLYNFSVTLRPSVDRSTWRIYQNMDGAIEAWKKLTGGER